MSDAPAVLGVLLAGGRNLRYGSHKALASLGGRTILERGLASLRAAAPSVGIVANEPGPYAVAGVPIRPDLRPDLGALGGVFTAVQWARDEGLDVALVLACDMPFVPGLLMRMLAAGAGRSSVCAPWSEGPRGAEPLCAAYGVGVVDAIDEALRSGKRAVISFWDAVEVRTLPPESVRSCGDPARMFWNVNRPEDLDAAERWLAVEAADGTEADGGPAGKSRSKEES